MKFNSSLLFPIALIFIVDVSSAQITFQKKYGGQNDDEGNSVQQTIDGGYIIAGRSRRTSAYNNNILIKTNEYGDTLWTKIFGSISNNSDGFAVKQTSDTGYIITGFASVSDGLNLIRTDTNGDTLWAKWYSADVGYSVQQTRDGGFIVTGRTNNIGAGLSDVYLVKTDANGIPDWAKSYGGASYDQGQSITQTSDSGYIIAGQTISFGLGNNDIYLIKTNSFGDTLWTKTIGDSGVNSANSIQSTFDGGFIITGTTSNLGSGIINCFLLKIDSVGNIMWSNTFSGINDVFGTSVIQSYDSGYVFVGSVRDSSYHSDAWIVKTNSVGDTLWTKCFGEQYAESANSISQTSDGGFIITGSKNVFDSLYYDVYLIKTDSTGLISCNEKNYPVIVSQSQFQVSLVPTIVTIGSLNYFQDSETIVDGLTYVTPVCNTVDINELKTVDRFLLFPNPTVRKFTIQFDKPIQKGTINIVDYIGNIIFNENIFAQKEIEVNFESISQGVYFVIICDEETKFSKKLIVQ